jgi:hypothetical protein
MTLMLLLTLSSVSSNDAALKFQLIGQSCGPINPRPCPCLARAIQKQEMLCTKDKQKPTAEDAALQMNSVFLSQQISEQYFQS